MIRIVIDTNVIVSALLQAHSPPAAILQMVTGGGAQLCIRERRPARS